MGAIGTHSLQIDDTSGTGASGTISHNGDRPFNFTSADPDLQLFGPQREAVYVNTITITAGFSGRVDILAVGTVSLDGRASTAPINLTPAISRLQTASTGP